MWNKVVTVGFVGSIAANVFLFHSWDSAVEHGKQTLRACNAEKIAYAAERASDAVEAQRKIHEQQRAALEASLRKEQAAKQAAIEAARLAVDMSDEAMAKLREAENDSCLDRLVPDDVLDSLRVND